MSQKETDNEVAGPEQPVDKVETDAVSEPEAGAEDAGSVNGAEISTRPAHEEDPLFPGWGSATHIDDLESDDGSPVSRLDQPHSLLGELPATAICGNDITSSCLYVSALAALAAGPLAPLCLAAVAAVLYLFRFIYAEVGSALPLNGGAYNVLLNTTGKSRAAAAACLTVLSYMATAVISAGEAMHYAHIVYHDLDIHTATIALLTLFAILNVIGISESAVVAVAIFLFHMLTLVLLVLLCGTVVVSDPSTLMANITLPMSQWPTTYEDVFLGTLFIVPLFFGFATAMLGVSGFESSANFIEEQKAGVFPKTLRNMWIAVALFNPLISVLSLGMLPLAEFQPHAESLLAEMARRAALALGMGGGTADAVKLWICVDAVVVLSGAVLTSYVGVTGLVRRMSLDRCLPQFLLRTNQARGTNHWIIGLFLMLCCSVYGITKGKITTLAGVYTLSFLCVMALFALGNLMLKVKRDRLPRDTKAPWSYACIAGAAVGVALWGNVFKDPEYVRVFGTYFLVSASVVGLMFARIPILLGGLYVSRWLAKHTPLISKRMEEEVEQQIVELRERSILFFSSTGDPAMLNAAARYVLENEDIRRLRIVHCYQEMEAIDAEYGDTLRYLDRCYPELRIDLVLVEGALDPGMVDRLSRRLSVPKNYMFIGTPGDHFPHQLSELGGVRLIM